MGKKSNKRFAKLRGLLNQDAIVNKNVFTIYLDGDLRSDEPPTARCTCSWSFGPNNHLLELGIESKKHEQENPGHYRRYHA